MKSLVIFILLVCFLTKQTLEQSYTPDWNSLDSRPLPTWYDQAKIGIFLHWGVYSVPAFWGEWFWWFWQNLHLGPIVKFMEENYPVNFTYADFAKEFRAELFDPNEWVDLFEAAGAKYVVLTSKHHEGFCMWPSVNSWNWNSMDVGPNRDLVGELAGAIRNRSSIRFGVYHSLIEWYNPVFSQDVANNFTTQNFVSSKTMPELYDLVYRYKPDLIWSDGDWLGNDTYWNSTHFLAWLYNESPIKDTVVVNDRWGYGDACLHGGYFTCKDNFNPGVLQPRKWENCLTMDGTWGYRRDLNANAVKTIETLIANIVQTVSCGGNILINVGPTKDGIIVPIFQERFRQMGQWLGVNGEAIYSTTPWKHQNDTINRRVWYTQNGSNVYAILLGYPQGGQFQIGAPITNATTTVSMLGYPNAINWTRPSTGPGLSIDFSSINIASLPCKWAWAFKLENVN